MANSGLVLLWEFVVRADQMDAFEQTYGPDGAWAELFRKGEGFVGTELIRDMTRQGRYITTDRWISAEKYQAFRAKYLSEYDALDCKCAAYTEREIEIGRFEIV